MSALAYADLRKLASGRLTVLDVACPLCGPDRRAPSNRSRPVLRLWAASPGFISYACARCGEHGYARDSGAPPLKAGAYARVRAEVEERHRGAAAVRRAKALGLWRGRQRILGSVAEVYLREARVYRGPLPPTLGFLPARGDYSPAMIAAFGFPLELEPSAIAIPESQIVGVHLTRLLRDGSDRERSVGSKAKIMIGFSAGSPIVVGPPSDGLGLCIAEGIEDALSAHEATGLPAWAAGCASRLPALAAAVPPWIESATVLVDNDPDGRRHAAILANALARRNIEVRSIILDEIVEAA